MARCTYSVYNNWLRAVVHRQCDYVHLWLPSNDISSTDIECTLHLAAFFAVRCRNSGKTSWVLALEVFPGQLLTWSSGRMDWPRRTDLLHLLCVERAEQQDPADGLGEPRALRVRLGEHGRRALVRVILLGVVRLGEHGLAPVVEARHRRLCSDRQPWELEHARTGPNAWLWYDNITYPAKNIFM